jgi:hypothetical protein
MRSRHVKLVYVSTPARLAQKVVHYFGARIMLRRNMLAALIHFAE